MYFKVNQIFILFFFFIKTFAQDCPEILLPAYANLPRECSTTIGSTCLITCPDDFDIIGSCFRTCLSNNSSKSSLKLSYTSNGKNLFNTLKKKRINFLPTTSINKLINSSKRSCCSTGFRKQFDKEFKLSTNTKSYKKIEDTCPSENLPQYHLLHTLSKMLIIQEDKILQKTSSLASWSGYQPYCVNTDISCPELDAPKDGYLEYCPNYAGLPCSIKCDSGYRLIGSRILLCTTTGKWSDVMPTCQQI